MSRQRRRLVAVFALCVAVGLAFGVGGYSTASPDRSVNVTVAEPSEAYLAFGERLQCGPGSAGDDQTLVRNRLPENTTVEQIDITVQAVGGYARVGPEGEVQQLRPGKALDLTVGGSYDPGDAAEIRVNPPTTSNVSGADSLRVQLDAATGPNVDVSGGEQTYAVDCPGTYSASGNETGTTMRNQTAADG